MQTYKKYNIKGFLGTIGSTGNAYFKFYDMNGKLLLTKEVSEGDEQVEVLNAVKIIVSGDGKEVMIYPDFETMTSKMAP